MNKINRNINDKFYWFIFLLVASFCTLYHLSNNSMIFVLDDEFGYWGNAAGLLSYPWGDLMSETAYYSMGYSVFLVPLMLLIDDAVLLYKSAVVLNGIFFFFQLLLGFNLAKEIFNISDLKRTIVVILSIVSVPSVFYIHFTETETILTTLYLLALLLLNKLENGDKFIYQIPLTFVLLWMIFTHRRSLPVVTILFLASCIILIRKKKLLLLLISGCSFSFLYFLYKIVMNYQKELFYSNSAVAEYNSSSAISMSTRYFEILANDFGKVIHSAICKIGMANISTYGCLFFVIVILIYRFIISKKKWSEVSVTLVSILLCAMAMILLESIQLCDFTTRRDFGTYTRYFDFVLPPIIMCGFDILSDYDKVSFRTYVLSWIVAISTIPSMYLATIKSDERFNVLCSPILGAFYQFAFTVTGSLDNDKFAFAFFQKVTIILAMLFLYCIYQKRNEKKILILCVIAVLLMGIGYFSEDWEKDRRNALQPNAMQVFEYINSDSAEVYYIKDDNGVRNPKYIQFLLGNRPINVVTGLEDIVDSDSESAWILSGKDCQDLFQYECLFESWVINLYRIN